MIKMLYNSLGGKNMDNKDYINEYEQNLKQEPFWNNKIKGNYGLYKKICKDPTNLKKAKKIGIIFFIIFSVLFTISMILMIIGIVNSRDIRFGVYFPIFFITMGISIFFLQFALIVISQYRRINKFLKEKNSNNNIDNNDGHVFETESNNHRFYAPSFDSSDRFINKGTIKEENLSKSEISTKVCLKCGYINPKDAKFCSQCGNEFKS